ncbi:MAG: hypothetical protein HUU35_12940, partial [Armatimonadetes bacterium]|nr:hypothetical protein [Armatimonadota bacterium]
MGGASFITFLADPQLASLTWLLLLILAVAGAVQVGWRGAGNTAILAPLVVLLLLALASALRSVYPRGALEGVAWLLLQVGLFGLALGLAEPPAALWGVLTAAVPVAMLGLAEAAGWRRPAV